MRKLLFIAFVALSGASLQATVMAPMFMDDLTGESQTVVYGTITAKRTEWGPGRRMIFTVYTVQPGQYLKGWLGTAFELREPGGELDGEGFHIASVPQFEVGQEAVMFVWTDQASNHQVTAFEQGVVSVITGENGVKQVSRSIPLGSARTGQISNAMVDSAADAAMLGPTVAPSEQSLGGLLNQIRLSVARTQPAGK